MVVGLNLAICVGHNARSRCKFGVCQRLILRNEILFALMRRPWKTAVRRTVTIVRHAYRDGVPLMTCAGAVLCLPKTLGKRRVVPREIEAMLCQLDLGRERTRHAEGSPQVVHV